MDKSRFVFDRRPERTAEPDERITPRARRLLEAYGVILGAVTPTGANGLVLERDVQAAIDAGYAMRKPPEPGEPARQRSMPVDLSHSTVAEPMRELPATVAEPLKETPASVAEPVGGAPALIAEPVEETPASAGEPASGACAPVEAVCETPAPNAAMIGIICDANALARTLALLNGLDSAEEPIATVWAMALFCVLRLLLQDRYASLLNENGTLLAEELSSESRVCLSAVNMARQSLGGVSHALLQSEQKDSENTDGNGAFLFTYCLDSGIDICAPVLSDGGKCTLGVGALTAGWAMDGGTAVKANTLRLALTYDARRVPSRVAVGFLTDLRGLLERFPRVLVEG